MSKYPLILTTYGFKHIVAEKSAACFHQSCSSFVRLPALTLAHVRYVRTLLFLTSRIVPRQTRSPNLVVQLNQSMRYCGHYWPADHMLVPQHILSKL